MKVLPESEQKNRGRESTAQQSPEIRLSFQQGSQYDFQFW